MRWAGLPLTLAIIIASVAISIVLFMFGIYFFFLPIIFIPFARFFRRPARPQRSCPACGLGSDGNFCPRCGTRVS
ncbi:MAG TPA: hypothetical protein VJ792_05465 [Candidatus Nitrosotalea sp.]|nr:hypothetical protein [Candidatus Nitrosotalea sp.]